MGDPGEKVADVAGAVHAALPEARFIAISRDPVARAISAYCHYSRFGWVAPSQRLLEVVDRFGITSMGRYDVHFDSWFKYFQRERFLILFYEEDLSDENKMGTLGRVFRHIGVDDRFVPERLYEKYNHSPPLPVTDAEREHLREVYRPHKIALRKLLCRALPW